VAAVLVVAGVGGCTGDQGEAPPSASSPPATATPAAIGISVRVRASAAGDGRGPALARAAATATPELQRFLTRYLTIALDPGKARGGYRELGAFFDPALRKAAARDRPALTLGAGGTRVTAVSAKPATAVSTFLIEGSRPIAATVRLSVNGTVSGAEGAPAPLSIRSTLNLERGKGGWHIVDYTTQARTPA
jgi:hypothetical protein